MKRGRGQENVVLRLAKRECSAAPAGAVTPQSRRLLENVVPDTPVPGLTPPPNTVLACFTPCGRYLLAFQPVANEIVAYRFKGLHVSTSRQHAAAQQRPAAPADGGAAAAAGQGPQRQLQQSASQGSLVASATTDGRPPAPQASQQEQQEQQQAGVSFGDIFEEHWRCCPCPGRQQQLSTDFCLVAHGRFLLVCTATPERQPSARAEGAAALFPQVDATTFHLVELEGGCLLDSLTLQDDYVELARNQGAHLRGQLLLVLGLTSQTLHMLQLLPSGRLLYLHAIGPHCRDDDALVLAQHEEQERRLRQHQAQQRQQLSCPGSSLAASSSFGSLLAAAQGGPSPMRAAGRAAGAALQPAAAAQQSDSEGSAYAAAATAAAAAAMGAARPGNASQGQQPATTWPLLRGLKQCLLAYLFREAQQQSQEAAAGAASSAAALGMAGPQGHGGTSSSTASLPGTAATATQPFGMGDSYSSSSSHARLPGGGGGGGEGVPQPQCWRRPLDRFFYYFETHAELLMWRAQLLDDQRLLIHWCAPDMLARPHRHHGHAPMLQPSLQGGSYLMLYNQATASVERLFAPQSPELVAWYLEHPAAFHGGACTCGCTTDWERCVVPPGASRVAREAQLRDPTLAAKELRRRLADELPACSQARQATPYLDPDLYCFDERAVGGAVRPHHPPHRALKFMCRSSPERLRFRLDPQHLMAPGGGAGSRAAAAHMHHTVYLFHPVQPFLLVVLQDVETAIAESLTVFTRL